MTAKSCHTLSESSDSPGTIDKTNKLAWRSFASSPIKCLNVHQIHYSDIFSQKHSILWLNGDKKLQLRRIFHAFICKKTWRCFYARTRADNNNNNLEEKLLLSTDLWELMRSLCFSLFSILFCISSRPAVKLHLQTLNMMLLNPKTLLVWVILQCRARERLRTCVSPSSLPVRLREQ